MSRPSLFKIKQEKRPYVNEPPKFLNFINDKITVKFEDTSSFSYVLPTIVDVEPDT